MGVVARAWEFLKGVAAGKLSSVTIQGPDPRKWLEGAAPGLWASNHLAEATQCKGWQFVATRAVARMCGQAEVTVHYVGSQQSQEREARRAIRLFGLAGDRTMRKFWRRELDAIRKAEPTAQGARTARRVASEDDPLVRLLKRRSPQWSGGTYLFAAAQQLCLTGSALIWRVANEVGVPVEQYILPTGLTTPRGPTVTHPEGSYYLAPISSWGMTVPDWMPGTLGQALLTGCEIDARDVKPVRWPHPVNLSDGLSPLAAGAVWIDVANEMDRANWYAMQNSERPGMIFSQDPMVDPDPADKTQFREDLAAEARGVPNTGRHLILPKGLAADSRSRTPADLDFGNGRPQYRDMSLALHGIGPVACGIAEAGSYGGFWASIKQTTELSIQPMLSLIAGEETELLGEAFPGPRREITYTARAIDDPQLLEQRLRTDITAGNVLRVNEYRAMRGLPAIPGPEGEEFVGVKKSVRAEDDPEEPGVQAGDGKEDDTDGTGDDGGPQTRQPQRDAVPGRQDRNGKAHTNGHVNGHGKARWSL